MKPLNLILALSLCGLAAAQEEAAPQPTPETAQPAAPAAETPVAEAAQPAAPVAQPVAPVAQPVAPATQSGTAEKEELYISLYQKVTAQLKSITDAASAQAAVEPLRATLATLEAAVEADDGQDATLEDSERLLNATVILAEQLDRLDNAGTYGVTALREVLDRYFYMDDNFLNDEYETELDGEDMEVSDEEEDDADHWATRPLTEEEAVFVRDYKPERGSVAEKIINHLDDTAAILKSVTDTAAAQAAVTKLKEADTEVMDALWEKLISNAEEDERAALCARAVFAHEDEIDAEWGRLEEAEFFGCQELKDFYLDLGDDGE